MSPTPSAASQRVKLALIPLLAVALLAVVFWPSGESGEAVDVPTLIAPTERTVAIARSVSPASPLTAEVDWGNVDLEAAIRTNPFAEPLPPPDAPTVAISSAPQSGESAVGSTRAAAAEEEEQETARVVRYATAVLERDGEVCAWLDGQLVCVGDTLADGSSVVAITAESVTLKGK